MSEAITSAERSNAFEGQRNYIDRSRVSLIEAMGNVPVEAFLSLENAKKLFIDGSEAGFNSSSQKLHERA